MNPAQRTMSDEQRVQGTGESALPWIRGRAEAILASKQSVLVLCAEPEGGVDPSASPTPSSEVETRAGQGLLAAVQAGPSGDGVSGVWAAGRFWVVVGGVEVSQLSPWCNHLMDRLRKGDGPAGRRWCVGASVGAPGQGRSVEVLRRVAEEGCELAKTAGGDRWMHTELYGLFQRQLERRAGRVTEVGSARSGELRELVVEVSAPGSGPGESEESQAPADPRAPDAAVPSQAELEAQRALAAEAEALRDRLQNRDREMDVLQRRLAKVNALLDDAESELAARRRGKPGDDGIESIYRNVQGLDEEDEQREKKGSLMRSIFDANLDLKRQRESPGV